MAASLVSFNDPPQVQWVANQAFAIYLFYFAFESLVPPVSPDANLFFSFASNV